MQKTFQKVDVCLFVFLPTAVFALLLTEGSPCLVIVETPVGLSGKAPIANCPALSHVLLVDQTLHDGRPHPLNLVDNVDATPAEVEDIPGLGHAGQVGVEKLSVEEQPGQAHLERDRGSTSVVGKHGHLNALHMEKGIGL